MSHNRVVSLLLPSPPPKRIIFLVFFMSLTLHLFHPALPPTEKEMAIVMVHQVGEFAFPMQSCKHQHKQNVTLGYPAVLSHLFYLPVTDTFYAMVNKFSLQLMCIQCSACINS